MLKVWEKYPHLTQAILRTHKEEGGHFSAHDFDHVIRTANYCHMIAEDEEVGHLAAVAALCHNADRIWQKKLGLAVDGEVPDIKVVEMVEGWLSVEKAAFSLYNRDCILDAVLNHSIINSDEDSPVLITLKDADRLVNSDLDIVMRHAQYFPNMPWVDPVHHLDTPGESFKTPKTILGNTIKVRREWADENLPRFRVRLPKAMEIMRQRLVVLESYAQMIRHQRIEVGLVPYPQFG